MRRRVARRRSDLGLFAVLPVGLLVLDLAGTIRRSNPAAQRLLGRPAADLHGRSVFDPAFAPVREDGTPFPPAEQAFARAPRREVVVGVSRPDGTRAWLLATTHLRRDGAGTPRRVLLTFMDITAHQEADEALRRSESRWRTLFEAAPVGIVATDAQFHFSAVNDAYCALVGYTREELIGRLNRAAHVERERVHTSQCGR